MKETPFQAAVQCLPRELRAAALQLPNEVQTCCEELRLRAGRGGSWVGAGTERPVPGWDGAEITRETLGRVVELATRASVHTALEQLRDGFLPLDGGHRLGLCGTVALREGEVIQFQSLSSLNLRIAREAPGISKELLPRLKENGQPMSTLILAPPGQGKTTLLRDLVRAWSVGEDGPPLRVALADERGEVAALRGGVPQLDVGQADVMDGCPKAAALLLLLRSMNPQVLAADEITAPADVEAMVLASHCGAAVLATAHGGGRDDLMRRPLYRTLWEQRVFRRLVTIQTERGVRRYAVEDLS